MKMYGFDRFEAKMRAKESMRLCRPSPLLVALVYLLLTTGVSLLVGRLIFDPTAFILAYQEMNYPIKEILAVLMDNYIPQMVVAGLVSLVLEIYFIVMGFGYSSYALRLSRDEDPSYSNLFDGFLKFGRVLWLSILQGLFATLWALPFFAAALAMLVWYNVSEFVLAGALGVVTYLVGAVLMVIKMYSYRMAVYFMLDDPSCTARQAITRSKTIMVGEKWTLFVLDLSFLGWAFAAAFTAGLLLIWLTPYMEVTEANFYNYLTSPEPEEGPDNDGPVDYHYNMMDNTKPF